jgi:hypothetical protein
VYVDQWAAAIAGIDRRAALNPCAGAGFAEFSHGTDDSFGHAELHGATAIVRQQRMTQARADRGFRLVKISAGIVFFERSAADGYAVDFSLATGWSAGDAKFFKRARRT